MTRVGAAGVFLTSSIHLREGCCSLILLQLLAQPLRGQVAKGSGSRSACTEEPRLAVYFHQSRNLEENDICSLT